MAVLAFVGIVIAGLGGILALTALARGLQKLSRSAALADHEPAAPAVSTVPEPPLETLPTVAEPRRRHAGRAV